MAPMSHMNGYLRLRCITPDAEIAGRNRVYSSLSSETPSNASPRSHNAKTDFSLARVLPFSTRETTPVGS
jgi:hypothetical protein